MSRLISRMSLAPGPSGALIPTIRSVSDRGRKRFVPVSTSDCDFRRRSTQSFLAQRVSFIVPCMGRLHFLKQTIAAACSQPDSEYVLVDYSCPECCGDWVEENYPMVRVVRERGEEFFNLARARNLGAMAATSEWLCFIDCDVIPSPEFLHHVRTRMKARSYLGIEGWRAGLSGLVVCRRTDFLAVKGFDERFEGWGGEDDDFKNRMRRLGLTCSLIEPTMASHIDHDDEVRTRYYREKDIRVSHARALALMAHKGSSRAAEGRE